MLIHKNPYYSVLRSNKKQKLPRKEALDFVPTYEFKSLKRRFISSPYSSQLAKYSKPKPNFDRSVTFIAKNSAKKVLKSLYADRGNPCQVPGEIIPLSKWLMLSQRQ